MLSKIDVIEKGGSNTVPGTTKTEHLTTMNGCGGKEEQFVAKWAKPWWEWAFKVTGTAGGKVLNIVKAELKVEAGGTYHGRQEGYEKTIKSIPCKKFNVNKVTKTSVTTYMVHAGVEEQHFCSECGRYVGSHKEWSGWCLATRKDHIESIAETPPQNCGAT